MTLSDLALFAALALFVVGFIGTFLPLIPGIAIVWLGILVHRLIIPAESVSWTFFWVATALAILAQVLDYAFSYWGARRFGASWQGAVGGIVGGIVGVIFLNILGLIIGPILGVIAVELTRSRNLRKAGRAGFGTVVGGLAAFVMKIFLTCLLIAGFFMSLAGWL
jgi:uncharacterized protein